MPWASKIHRPVDRNKVKRAMAKTVVSRSLRGYTHEWYVASKEYLKQNPLCVDCIDEGIRSPSQCTDHEIPHKGDMALFWDRSNWRARCKHHHDVKTATRDGGFGNETK
jgi:5-methylcytosine-specific restriction enzyme A